MVGKSWVSFSRGGGGKRRLSAVRFFINKGSAFGSNRMGNEKVVDGDFLTYFGQRGEGGSLFFNWDIFAFLGTDFTTDKRQFSRSWNGC